MLVYKMAEFFVIFHHSEGHFASNELIHNNKIWLGLWLLQFTITGYMSIIIEKWLLHVMSKINFHGAITPHLKFGPANSRLQIRYLGGPLSARHFFCKYWISALQRFYLFCKSYWLCYHLQCRLTRILNCQGILGMNKIYPCIFPLIQGLHSLVSSRIQCIS